MARIESDYYPTPQIVVDDLLKYVTFRENDSFLEPCRGEARRIYNSILDVPESRKSFAELSEGIDYLATPFDKHDVIITNPPFSISEEFLRKAMREIKDDGTLIFLQRVNWLGSKKRVPMWTELGTPNKLCIIIPRVSFINGKTDSTEYAWFIWDFGNRVSLPEGISHTVYR